MSLQLTKDNFINSLNESRDLYLHCLIPRGLHTDSGIEAAFLQLHKNWEVFLEQILVCFLSGEQVLSGNTITCKFIVPDKAIVREILYQDKSYIEWTDESQIKKRFARNLIAPNRINDTLNTISVEIKDITKIRNFIAHSSGVAKTNYVNLVRSRIGGNPDVSRASKFLLQTDQENAPQTIFEKYLGVLEIACEQMVG